MGKRQKMFFFFILFMPNVIDFLVRWFQKAFCGSTTFCQNLASIFFCSLNKTFHILTISSTKTVNSNAHRIRSDSPLALN